MIESVQLPPPVPGERALYKRAISRSHAEWPLVEVCARAVVSAGAFQFIRITAGGIAGAAAAFGVRSRALQGKPAIARDASPKRREQATAGAKPLPMTGYKLDLADNRFRTRTAHGRPEISRKQQARHSAAAADRAVLRRRQPAASARTALSAGCCPARPFRSHVVAARRP